VFYWRRWDDRPRAERREQTLAMLVLLAVVVAAVATGHAWELLVLLLFPSRLAVLYLAWAFDYLPHHHLHHTPSQDKLKATRNRVGLERLLTPLLLYQNYHLVHHLHPVIPFYRYISVWRRNEESYLEGDPELTTARGRRLTPDEYRALRGLVEHHD
jgi:fatty acid desaturase